MTWVPLHLQGNLQGNLLVQGSSDDGRRPPAVRPHDHISATALNLNSRNFRDAPGSGSYALRCRVLGFNRNCIGFVSGVLSCFGEVLFFAFAVMAWVLSGVVGGGWFWGAEGLGLKGWGFGGFPECPWWWSRGGGPWSRGVRRGGPIAWWCSRGGGVPLVVVVCRGGGGVRGGGGGPWWPSWWSRGGGPMVVAGWRWSVAVVRGGGLVVVVPWWWSCGGCLVVVVPWWWSRGGGLWWLVRGGGPWRGSVRVVVLVVVVVVSWWWSCGGGLVVVVSWGRSVVWDLLSGMPGSFEIRFIEGIL